jgi:hypothetical protein
MSPEEKSDRVRLASNNSIVINTYADAAEQYSTRLTNRLDFVKTHLTESSGYPIVTSDYGLYWFDYKAGYDAIFAEFGWNYSRQLNVAICRGASTAYGKDWGVIITWTYTTPPYIESGEELYTDLVLAYENGAKYIVVFDGNEGWTEGILQPKHLDALKRFWNYIQDNPRQTTPVSEKTAYILPEAYGYGFRGPEDHIWGVWEADALTPNITISVASLLTDYGEKLDIIYEDGLQPSSNYGYNQLIRWDSYTLPPPKITILSPKSSTYAENNITLAFTINKPATWIGYSLDNQENVQITENTTLTNLPKGRHNITIYAKDEFETLGASETLSFDIDPPEPFPALLVVAGSLAATAVAAVSAVGFLVYSKKRTTKSEGGK